MDKDRFKRELEQSLFDYFFIRIPINERDATAEKICRNDAREHAAAVCNAAEELEDRNGHRYMYLHIQRLRPYVELKPRIIGLGGEAMIIEGRVHWDEMPETSLVNLKAHDIVQQDPKWKLDQIVQGARRKAQRELRALNPDEFYEERERLIRKIRTRFPQLKCAIRIPKPNAESSKREYRGRAFAGINLEGILCYLEHGPSTADKEVAVMEFIEDVVHPNDIRKTFGIDEMIEIMIRASQGLAYCHSNNVLHRDIKPENMLVDRQGRCYITDLGLIKLYNKDEEGIDHRQSYRSLDTASKTICGTLQYLPPEGVQNKGIELLTEKSDVYMFAGSCYKILTGFVPNQPAHGNSDDWQSMMLNILKRERRNHDRLVLVQRAKPEYERELKIQYLQYLIAHGMQLRQEDRPTMQQFLEDLQDIQKRTTPSHTNRAVRASGLRSTDYLQTVFDIHRTFEDIRHLDEERP